MQDNELAMTLLLLITIVLLSLVVILQTREFMNIGSAETNKN